MDGFLGEIRYFGFGFPPRNWELCNGKLMPIQPNQALFSLIGNRYGGVPGQSFALPNLGGAAVVGFDCATDPGRAGTRSGDAQYAYSDANVPSHSHGFRLATALVGDMQGAPGFTDTSLGGFYQTDGTLIQAFAAATSPLASMDRIIQNNPGQPGNAVYSVMQPYMTLSACICVEGAFPTNA